jgi:hypothetical protein
MTEDEDRGKEAMMTKAGNRIVIISETMLSEEYFSVTAAGHQDRSCTPHPANTPSVGRWALTLFHPGPATLNVTGRRQYRWILDGLRIGGGGLEWVGW